jgi:WD40 repeat protein
VAVVPEGDPRILNISDDGRFLAIGGWEFGGVGVWDARSGQKLAQLKTGPHVVPLFSPDGKYLVTSPDGISLWRTDDWSPAHQLHAAGTTPAGLGIVFSPDSRALAVGHMNGAISLYDPRTGEEFARWSGRESTSAALLSFSVDQQLLITSATDERSPAQVWNLAAMREALAERQLDWPADVLQPAATSKRLEGQIELVIEDGGIFSPPNAIDP